MELCNIDAKNETDWVLSLRYIQIHNRNFMGKHLNTSETSHIWRLVFFCFCQQARLLCGRSSWWRCWWKHLERRFESNNKALTLFSFLITILNFFQVGQEVEIRPGFVHEEWENVVYKPILSRVISLKSEENELEFAVLGGLIGMISTSSFSHQL